MDHNLEFHRIRRRRMRLFPFFSLFLFVCLFPTSASHSGRVLPPGNLTTRWVSDFELGLFWDPPPHSVADCRYFASVNSHSKPAKASFMSFEVMDKRLLRCSVTTDCNGTKSEPAFLDVSFPELVRNFECFLHAPQRATCRWSPVQRLPDLQFFYGFRREGSGLPPPPDFQECPSYKHTGGLRTGCDLSAIKFDVVKALVNGTLDNKPVRNTFMRILLRDIRPPPLNWTVSKSWNKFDISWTPPVIEPPEAWNFEIKYTECGATPLPMRIEKGTSKTLTRAPDCQYRIAIRAKNNYGETPWSDWRQFDADPNTLLYLTVIVPLAIVVLAILICVGFQRNKEKIFPKVPEPRNFLSDILDNDKSPVHTMYVPVKEQENFKVTLVSDP